MKTIINLIFIFIFFSCRKQEFKTNPPLSPVPIKQDSTIVLDNSVSLTGQTWIITSYKIGDFSTPITRNDTLKFLNNKIYTFNNETSTYNLYPSLSSYTLSLNGTFIGNLTGTIYENNLKTGFIEGIKFKDLTPGGNISNYYFLWIKRF